MPLGKGGGFL